MAWTVDALTAPGRRRLAGVDGVEVSADDLEGQVVVALHREHEVQPVDIGGENLR